MRVAGDLLAADGDVGGELRQGQLRAGAGLEAGVAGGEAALDVAGDGLEPRQRELAFKLPEAELRVLLRLDDELGGAELQAEALRGDRLAGGGELDGGLLERQTRLRRIERGP